MAFEDKEWFYGFVVRDEEARVERRESHKIIGILAIVGVLVGLFLGGWANAAEPAKVDVPLYVHESQGLKANLYATPCADPRVMEMIVVGMPKYMPRFQAIEATFRMRTGEWKDFSGCWIELTAEEVGFEALFLLFEDGDKYLVNKAEFLAKPKQRGERGA